MRILVVTNLYPPHHIGGYELGCRDVVEKLRSRGHTVQILTSSYRSSQATIDEEEREEGVERTLHLFLTENDPRPRKLRECRLLWTAIRRHRPDIVYFWNQAGLSHWLPVMARVLSCRMAFFLSDTQFISWRVGAFFARWGRKLDASLGTRLVRSIFGTTFLIRGWPVIENQPCHFASRFLRDWAERAGIAIDQESSVVAHWGIDPGLFVAPDTPRWPPRRLLYVGQLIPQKGVHTAITALGLLAQQPGLDELSLTIVGGGLHPKYEEALGAMPAELGVAQRVQFLGKVRRTELPRVYAEHDILVFPSEWDEPFAITPIEAMASGLTVVGTVTGGSGEAIRDRTTAITFRAGDAHDCARAIRKVYADRSLRDSIRERALQEVTARYTLSIMVDTIETSFRRLVA